MADTSNLMLPLLASAQAQKHITMNEALTRLDMLCQLRLTSVSTAAPPGTPREGNIYAIPTGATGDWSSRVGKLALWYGGAWSYLAPQKGWRGYVIDQKIVASYDGTAWQTERSFAENGAATALKIAEYQHTLSAGPSNILSNGIPIRASVLGVTARVTTAITGATSFKVGVAGSADRYGSGIGVAKNSELIGLSGAPVAYYAPTDLLLTADGGNFAGGGLNIAVHYIELTAPSAV